MPEPERIRQQPMLARGRYRALLTCFSPDLSKSSLPRNRLSRASVPIPIAAPAKLC